MEGRHELETSIRCAGRQQLQILAYATIHSLERAGLKDVIEELKKRVLDRGEEVCDLVQTEEDSWRVMYKPMIELLLYEVKYIARAPHVSDEERRIRIEWAMTLAGV